MKHEPITLVIFPDPEAWLRENVPLMGGDRVACVRPTTEFNLDGLTGYKDYEDGTTKQRTLADHVRALRLLCEQVGRTLFVGGVKNPHALTDLSNWDVEVVDAFWQLAYRSEVIYG